MGSLFLECKSEIDGKPLIVAFSGRSKNRKTSDMIQVWIMRKDVNPNEAVKTGADVSICGQCPRRWSLGGDCYVIPGRGPLNVWKSVLGKFADGKIKRMDLRAVPASFKYRKLRLGAYGDPAAVPLGLWHKVFKALKPIGHTGYTHQWRTCDPKFQNLVMASVDSQEEMQDAQSLGWRTFRPRGQNERIEASEFACPAAKESGARLDCASCLACDGGQFPKASVTIIAHGCINQKGLVGLRVTESKKVA